MFTDVVELYRAVRELVADEQSLAKEVYQNGTFSYEGIASGRLENALTNCSRLPEHMGGFSVPVDRQGSNVRFTWRLSQNSHVRFFRDTEALVLNSDTIHQGHRPENFFLVEDNFSCGEEESSKPCTLRRLESLCEFISGLSKLAGQEEQRQKGPAFLFFMLPAREGRPPRPVQIRTKISPRLLDYPELDISLLKSLGDKSLEGTTHHLEKQALLRVAIADIASGAPDGQQFSHLVSEWSSVLGKFRHDFECYVSQYDFDTFISKLADTKAEFASRLTRVMGDTAAKFLALPLPFVALFGILHTDSIGQSYLIFLGALLLALLYSAQVRNQMLEVSRVRSAFDLVVTRLHHRQHRHSGGAFDALNTAVGEFREQEALLIRTLRILWGLAWAPIAAGLLLLAYRYHPLFQDLLDDYLMRLF